MYAIIFILSKSAAVFVMTAAILVVPSMVFIVWGRHCLRRIISGLAAAALLEGVTRALGGLKAAFVLFLPLRFVLWRLVGAARRERGLYELTLRLGEREADCVGLYDSGCLLTMPFTGEPVNIASPEVLRVLDPGAGELIPYNALGTLDGQIEVVCLDEMRIHMRKGVRIIKHPRFGRAQDNFLSGRPYRVILNAGVIEYE